MKGLLSIIKKALPASPDGGMPAREEFDRRLAAFRKANGVMESCVIEFTCGQTRRPFELRFERASPGELFTPAPVRQPEGDASSVAKSSPRTARAFNAAEFDLSRWVCPFCRAQTFVRCRCGITCCDPRDRRLTNNLFECVACGLKTPTIPLARIEARQGGGIRSPSGTPRLGRLDPTKLISSK